MKRDMVLIKQILKYVEKNGYREDKGLFAPDIPGFTDQQVKYHIMLCAQAGFVQIDGAGLLDYLTWLGHNKLESLRSGE